MLSSKSSSHEEKTTNKSTMTSMFSSDMCGHGTTKVAECELRPGGMLVQKRDDSNRSQISAPASSTIKIKVKYDSSYHEIRINSHASFGELKKMLAERTGLHAQDQKLIYKKKERDSKSYLDLEKVKDGSKLVLLEDIKSRERRTLETLRAAKKEKATKSLIQINQEVDKLARKVSALEAAASRGGITAEMEIEGLTENLMRILITLDEIYAEGELKLQKREQVRRVQKHIETLDMLRMPRSKSNSIPLKNKDNLQRERKVHSGAQKQHMQGNKAVEVEQITKKQPLKHPDSVVVTTKWETFD